MSTNIYSQKYYNLYYKIINKYVKLNLKKSKDLYLERHHVIPKCMGGLDTKDNLVNIPAREHFLLHWMLCRIYKDNYKLACAFHRMCNKNKEHNRYTSHSFKYARELFANRNVSQETKKKMSISKLGKLNNFYGKKHSEETKKSLSLKRKNTNKGEHNPFYNKEHSEETKRKISIKNSGDKNGMFGKILCNNGVETKPFYPTEIPINWVKGSLRIPWNKITHKL